MLFAELSGSITYVEPQTHLNRQIDNNVRFASPKYVTKTSRTKTFEVHCNTAYNDTLTQYKIHTSCTGRVIFHNDM